MVYLGGLPEVSVESDLVGLLHTELELEGCCLEPVGSPGHQGGGGHQAGVHVIERERLEADVDWLVLSAPSWAGERNVAVAIEHLGSSLLTAVGQEVVHHHAAVGTGDP